MFILNKRSWLLERIVILEWMKEGDEEKWIAEEEGLAFRIFEDLKI